MAIKLLAKELGDGKKNALKERACACIYVAIKNTNCNPSFSLRDFDGNKKHIARYYRQIVMENNFKIKSCWLSPEMYIKKDCSKIKLPKRLEAFAYRLTKKLKKFHIASGRSPTCLALAIIYIASNIDEKYFITQEELIRKFERVCSSTTLRTHYLLILYNLRLYILRFKTKYLLSILPSSSPYVSILKQIESYDDKKLLVSIKKFCNEKEVSHQYIPYNHLLKLLEWGFIEKTEYVFNDYYRKKLTHGKLSILNPFLDFHISFSYKIQKKETE